MTLKRGIVFSAIRAPKVYNEIIRMYGNGKNRMIEVSQFGPDIEDETIVFYQHEIVYALKRGIIVIVNNWTSRN